MLMAEYSYETDIEVQREEAAEEANKRADKIFIDIIEKASKSLQLSIKDTCNKLGESYDDYLRIKETL